MTFSAGTPSDELTFDLLILDEAHHVAPAAPRQEYAVDSQQTKLMRRLAPHFEHRLFLSATPLLISIGTVKTHLGSVQTKLGARNRIEIAAWAWERRLVT